MAVGPFLMRLEMCPFDVLGFLSTLQGTCSLEPNRSASLTLTVRGANVVSGTVRMLFAAVGPVLGPSWGVNGERPRGVRYRENCRRQSDDRSWPIGLIQTPSSPSPALALHHRPNDLRRVLHTRVDPGQSDRLTGGEESSSDSTNSCPPSGSGRAAPNADRSELAGNQDTDLDARQQRRPCRRPSDPNS
jgi:hypothetical protein